MERLPDLEESDVVLPAAERTRPVAGGERGRLVEEEQLRELAGLEERGAVPVLEAKPAGDPAPSAVAPDDPAALVVQAAAVPVDEAAGGCGDQLAERRDAVLARARHTVTIRPARPVRRGSPG